MFNDTREPVELKLDGERINNVMIVYFDTCFFNWLGEAPFADADAVISQLAELEVQYVMSMTLLQELLTGSERRSHRAIRALQPLKCVPFLGGLRWRPLLAYEGESERLAAAEVIRNLSRHQARISAVGAVADSGRRSDVQPLLPPKQVDIPIEGVRPAIVAASAALRDWRDGKPVSPSTLNRHLPPEVREWALLTKQIRQDTFGTDPRPVRVAGGTASKAECKRLGQTTRDIERMVEFVFRSGQIDLLQLDRAQFNQIHARPSCRMHVLKHRLFRASGLSAIVDSILATCQQVGTK